MKQIVLTFIVLLLSCTLSFGDSLSLQNTSNSETFITGHYSGSFGFCHYYVPESYFSQSGQDVSGWLLLVTDDFVAKQFLKGKIVYDMSSSVKNAFRSVKVDFLGTHVEYLLTTGDFDARIKKNRKSPIFRQMSFSNFMWNNYTLSTDFIGHVQTSGISRGFPLQFYPMTGNLILTKSSGPPPKWQNDAPSSYFVRSFFHRMTETRNFEMTSPFKRRLDPF
ncbi:MAG: hypothetical protein JW928_08625 [Candidatus Aureabacteria bacterium]|nr:hypothetical protein [Candidatus Auribacterota bacterium]